MSDPAERAPRCSPSEYLGEEAHFAVLGATLAVDRVYQGIELHS